MRRMRSLLSPLAVVALALAAHPAAAQQLAVASIRTSAGSSVASDDPNVRALAKYSFEGRYSPEMPIEVMVSDSLGTVIGSYRVRGSSTTRPLQAQVEGTDVFLQAPTRAGTLTIVIYQLGERERSSDVIGHWMLGDKQGELLRRSAR